MFKFSLRLCIWLVLLVSSVLGLVLDREPWVLGGKSDLVILLGKDSMKTPDGSRYLDWGNYDALIRDVNTHEVLSKCRFSSDDGFLDDDTVLQFKDNYEVHRRFPEWWWGIFYRPLFWIAVVVFVGTVFEFVSMRKRLRTR